MFGDDSPAAEQARGLVEALSDPVDVEAVTSVAELSVPSLLRKPFSAQVAVCSLALISWVPSLTQACTGAHLFLRIWVVTGPAAGNLAAVGACIYFYVVSKKPRPIYVHCAGIYFIVCVLGNLCVSGASWAVCNGHPDSVHIGMFALGFVIYSFSVASLQAMIVLKVWALRTKDSDEARRIRPLIQLAPALCYSWAAVAVLRYSLSIQTLLLPLLLVETALGTAALAAFLVFIVLSVRALLECRTVLRRAARRGQVRELRLERALNLHMALTVVANSLTGLCYASILLVGLLSWLAPSLNDVMAVVMVVLSAGDLAVNIPGALFLSGIAAAAREALWSGSVAWVSAAPLGMEPDVLGRLAEVRAVIAEEEAIQAAKAVQSVSPIELPGIPIAQVQAVF